MRAAALALFGRSPSSPDAKTRLRDAPPGAARALFLDTLAVASRLAAADLIVCFTPPEAASEMRMLAPGAADYLVQRGGDLGERMAAAFADLFARGYARVLLVGTDLPTLPISHLETAEGWLASGEAGVVLGPADDGGYYLIGLTAPCPDLFAGIAWSTRQVFEQTVAAARRAGLILRCVPAWRDIDGLDDLHRLACALDDLPPDAAPHVRRWLAQP